MSKPKKHFIISDINEATGVDINKCYQCGKCTAGCVLANDMDLPVSLIMRMLQTHTEENYYKILSSKSIWLCVNCENCIGRCPKQIDIPKVMDYLRQTSIKTKTVSPHVKSILSFHRAFLDTIKNTGRLNEMYMTIRYKLYSKDLWKDIKLAPEMIMKGKLHFLPEKIRNNKNITTIFNHTEKIKKP